MSKGQTKKTREAAGNRRKLTRAEKKQIAEAIRKAKGDGMVMLMAKQESIRDVIAFPKVKDASCLMTEAPNLVDEKQLEELGIAIRSEE